MLVSGSSSPAIFEHDSGEREGTLGLDQLEALEPTTVAERELTGGGERKQDLAVHSGVGNRTKLSHDHARSVT
jgi:hypothetical protein